MESCWNFLSTWPIPRSDDGDDDNEAPVWAVGTTQTCTAQGFFLTLSVAVPIYNAFLALYYMLVINHNVRDRTLRRVVEPAMHVAAAVWAFGTSLTAVGLHLLHDANLWCWIAPAPCPADDNDNCGDGDNAWIFRWVFYFGPLWFCILVASKYSGDYLQARKLLGFELNRCKRGQKLGAIFDEEEQCEILLTFCVFVIHFLQLISAICTYRVYKRVNSLDRRTLRFRRPAAERIDRRGRRSSRFVFDGSDNDSSFNNSFSGNNNAKMSLSRGSMLAIDIITNNDNRHHRRSDTATSLRSFMSSGGQDRSTLDLMEQEKNDDMFLSGHADDDERNESSNMNILARWKSHRSIYREDYPRSVEVMHQAIWYLGAFYLTHLWSTSNRIVQALNNSSTYFPLILLHAWFDPFQGALNYVVYQRPRYLKIRKFCPELTQWEACRKALLFSYLPTPSSPAEPRTRREDFATGADDSQNSVGRRRYPDSEVRSISMPSIVEGMGGTDMDASCKSGHIEESSQEEIAAIPENGTASGQTDMKNIGNHCCNSSEDECIGAAAEENLDEENGSHTNENSRTCIDNDYAPEEHKTETG